MPSSREFPDGRWFNHTIITKDTWVATKAEEHIAYRIDVETNRSLQRKSEDEYGQPGRVTVRFQKNPDCANAYRALFCYLNFPRCDVSRDMTYPTCRSACENYFKSCRYGKGLWRCGQSKYFNGYEPEVPVVNAQGNVTYLRDYFPGQPFRKNKYTTGGSEIGFCTPAITGSASKVNMGSYVYAMLSVILGVGLLFL
ncbi:hypothetical protein EON65_24710 [archaeon]|nr:MAG: hypothetical protein EON65_24710 [archaeon]